MSDSRRIKELLLGRLAELAQYLFPNGHREGNHWCIGSINGDFASSQAITTWAGVAFFSFASFLISF